MQRRLLTFAARIAVACALMGMAGCATIIKGSKGPIHITSTPSDAKVEIKSGGVPGVGGGGFVLAQGRTPMSIKLGKGKDYAVIISLDGYESQIIPVEKGGLEPVAFANCLFGYCSPLPFSIDWYTGAFFKLEPNTINVQLREITALDGSDAAIYAFLTIVDEDGKQQLAAIEMMPISAN